MPTFAIVILVLFSAVLAGVVAVRPAITGSRAGKILAFGVLFFLPLFCPSGMGGLLGTSFALFRGEFFRPRFAALPSELRSVGIFVLCHPFLR